MTAITFDTLKYVKTLKAAGFEEPQAEALAEVQREIFSANLDDLVTKRDIKELELATKQGFREIELSNKRDIKELELKIAAEIAPLKWGITVCAAGIMTLILKSFFLH